jgi:poly(3-hydroxybutyrate) depolymerase
MTIEGEKDDITGLGQCEAAHGLCANLPRAMKKHVLAPKVGHYGIFNGSRYRNDIVPQVTAFIRAHDVRVSRFRRFVTSLRRRRGIETAPQPLPVAAAPNTERPSAPASVKSVPKASAILVEPVHAA